MSELCLTLLCPFTVEEKLLDLLLMWPEAAVFTSTPTAAHGLDHGDLSQEEQVLGRSLATQVQVIISAADKAALLERIRNEFVGTGLRYWLTTVDEAGAVA